MGVVVPFFFNNQKSYFLKSLVWNWGRLSHRIVTFIIKHSCLAVAGLRTEDRCTLSVVMLQHYAELCKLKNAQRGNVEAIC